MIDLIVNRRITSQIIYIKHKHSGITVTLDKIVFDTIARWRYYIYEQMFLHNKEVLG